MPVDKRLDPERWQKLVSIFEHAHPLRGDEQSAYLDEACGGDAELRYRAEALLREDSTGGATLQDKIQAAMGGAGSAPGDLR